jgi:MFS family permease
MATAATTPHSAAATRPMTREEKKVILASSLGTVFEWYDFYLYGSLATIIGAQFFSAFDVTTRNVFALLAFAAGFLVRPFGAIFFGRIGDLVGRKYTFLVTILIMGFSTFLVGLLPSYAQIGWIAHAPGLGAWGRVWRRRGLCSGARSGGPSRLLHQLHPDHGDRRPAALARRHPRAPHLDGRAGLPDW